MVKFISTRGDSTPKSFVDVMLAGLAPDQGLYVPDQWPQINVKKLAGLSYPEIVYNVIKPFVGGEIPDDDLHEMIVDVYNNNFKHPAVAPLVQADQSTWIMELFHGPTLAFKDYPLQLLGRLFDYVLEKRGQRLTIVGATSGDTGSAAIEAMRHCKNIDIFIMHPEGRTSDVQRRQMTSVISPNVHNIALRGTFDDCQNALKAMFKDETFRDEMRLSAVNSINFVRIAAQIAYYFAAGSALGAGDRKISFAVPTGNFGNVYAAFSAKQMGLPIEKLIIGSNRNDILTRFFETASMTTSTVEPSLSPSMDIQVSSNFERYLFELVGRKPEIVRGHMDSLAQSGSYTIDDKLMAKARETFSAQRCSDAQTTVVIHDFFNEAGYTLDPHTAVGFHAARLAKLDPAIPLVVMATAHPAKFPAAVKEATGVHPELPTHMADLYERKEKFVVLPNDLAQLKSFIRAPSYL